MDVNIADGDGVPALHKAVANGHLAVARLLLARQDININAKNKVLVSVVGEPSIGR